MTGSSPPRRFARLNRAGRRHRVGAAIANPEIRHSAEHLAPLARRAAVCAALLAAAALPAAASSLSGAYLAAMQADLRNDYAEAADYYDQALALDPANIGLLTNAVVGRVAMGDVAAARPLADRLDKADPGNQVAALVRLGDALGDGDFADGRDDARRGRGRR